MDVHEYELSLQVAKKDVNLTECLISTCTKAENFFPAANGRDCGSRKLRPKQRFGYTERRRDDLDHRNTKASGYRDASLDVMDGGEWYGPLEPAGITMEMTRESRTKLFPWPAPPGI